MSARKKYPIEFTGEVIEVINLEGDTVLRVICNQDRILEALDRSGLFKLGDRIRIDGSFEVTGMNAILPEEGSDLSTETKEKLQIIHSKPNQTKSI